MDTNPAINRAWHAVRDHSRAHEAFTYVYPVISRRSGGLSLGVNLNPNKRCNFDCVYCEVDRRTPGKRGAVDLARLGEELTLLVRSVREGALANTTKFREAGETARVIRDIAFSGDGEPTMVPNFAACVEVVVAVKQQEGLTEAKLVLITNATGLDRPDVQRGIEWMAQHRGEVWGKLDAGTEEYYRRVNRSRVPLDRILENLLLTARVRPIVIQSLFFRMAGSGMPPAEVEAYCDRLEGLMAGGGQIREVHAYTVARPTPEPWATALTADELEALAARIRVRTGLAVRTFA